MYDRETVELALYALDEGMTPSEAAGLVGASRQAVCRWRDGFVPHERGAGSDRQREDGTHDFSAAAPNEKWASDITEFRLPGDSRKACLSPVLDLFDGRPAG